MAATNILWIVTTQWRGQALSFAGDPNARTPALDALAAHSVRFGSAVTNHPFGPFARAALLTGRLSPANEVTDYFDPLPGSARTIAHWLGAAGYDTAFIGKWHLYRRDPDAPVVGEAHARIVVPPEARGGFAYWRGFESGFLLNDPWVHGTDLPQPVRLSGYQSDRLVDLAQEYVAAPANRPRFLMLSLEPPHPPYGAAAGVVPQNPDTLVLRANVPLGGEVEEKARRELAGYYAHIEATDRAIGRLLKSLDGAGRADQWVIFFTSVHGDMHGSHGLFRKGWPHEESIRVPLLVRISGCHGREDTAVASLADLVPTTLAFAGVKRPSGIAGRDLFDPTEKGGEALIGMPSVPPFAHQCPQVWRGIRAESWMLALDAAGKPWQAYDLAADPWQLRNLATVAGPLWEDRRRRVLDAWAAVDAG